MPIAARHRGSGHKFWSLRSPPFCSTSKYLLTASSRRIPSAFCCQSPSTSGLISEDSITWLRLHRFASLPTVAILHRIQWVREPGKQWSAPDG
ncbi:hypothetical protein FA95DRAFT_1201052 [Auriscalpium vulgare]|uniref:Uncharacterized protein n=1 Tax=Auriscalpium vulgare TaxID=40419 RepID=A0ACB8R3E3_9AGAM|nr:hypothetical protein FA95DRAFT_1201052 [Auriscalpium vulgare]